MTSKILGLAILVLLYLFVALFAGLLWPVKAVAAVVAVIIYTAINLPAWSVRGAAYIVATVTEHGPDFALMVGGWTAWVCLCVLLYMGGEWLITHLLGRSSR